MSSFENLLSDIIRRITDNNALYELGGDKKWIADTICQYNKLGFLTWTSQPGRCYESYVYETMYNRKYKIGAKIQCLRLQRAFIRGYMYRDVARKLCNYIDTYEFLFMKTSENNRIFTGDIEFGSMCFINNIPIIKYHKEIEFEYSDEEEKLHPDSDESYHLGVPVHKPLIDLMKFDEKADIVEVEIFDTRWNNNDLLWVTILKFLQDCKIQNLLLIE